MGRWLERKTDVYVVVTENYEEMSAAAANVIAEQLKAKPDSVLGLATGTTPIGLYAELVRACGISSPLIPSKSSRLRSVYSRA